MAALENNSVVSIIHRLFGGGRSLFHAADYITVLFVRPSPWPSPFQGEGQGEGQAGLR